jgi:hypothetical protein
LLGEHLLGLDTLRIQWNDFRDKAVQISPESSRKLGFNNYAVLATGGDQFKLALFSLAVNRLDFLMPFRSPDLAQGITVAISLYFQKFRFTVTGTIEKSERLPTGVQKIRASLNFSPELCDLMSDYFFASHLAAKRA